MELTCVQCGEAFGSECRACREQFCEGCARLWAEGEVCTECAAVQAAAPAEEQKP